MSLALYRKYRSKSFDDVVGQDHITKTLKKSVDSNNFSHAYLLTGLRGVGKTSIARIFAAYVNGIKYEEAENNPDIIEIDAASNRKIDEIRDLREKVNIAPSNLKYKVYIIDEVHMLTREAFNALLKTLEEPPAHCILILATTDYHKLPETIVSRCIRFSFRAISDKDIKTRLSKIASKENININDQALQRIVENSGGSLRDAITVLDQARNISNEVSAGDIELLLGLANNKQLLDLFESLRSRSTQAVIDNIDKIKDSGASPDQVMSQFGRLLRSKILASEAPLDEYSDLLTEMMKIYDYADKWLAFEVCILKHLSQFSSATDTVDIQVLQEPPQEQEIEADTEVVIEDISDKTSGEASLWQSILGDLKKTNSTLYGVARMAEAEVNGNVLELRLKFNFHKKQLDIKQNRLKIMDIAIKHNADIESINTIAIKEETSDENSKKYDSSKDISNISNVFGSAEMLE